MEQLSIENGQLTTDSLPMKLNEIACVTFTTGKELFFDPYQKNKQTGAFILIDPITNNTSAVGMILDKLSMEEEEAADNSQLSIVNCQLNLSALGIGEEHYEAIEKACKALEKQGVKVELTK